MEVLQKLYSIMLKGFANQRMEDIGPLPFIVLMSISLAVSIFISYLYLKFYKNRSTGSQIHRAFPLLGLSVTAIFIGIQFSLPLSLGLLGALSIVRFRTPIKEPEEIGFIMLVIASSISCATFNFLFLAILLIIAFIGLLIINNGPRLLKGPLNDGIIMATIPPAEYKQNSVKVLSYFENKFPDGKIESILENHDNTVLSYSFKHIDNSDIVQIQVDIKELHEEIKTNIFFNRTGDI